MSDMSNNDVSRAPSDMRVSVRVPREVAHRIDQLASHCGHGRSRFVRTSIELADAQMVLTALRAVEARGALSADQQDERRAAHRRLAQIRKELSPTPLTTTQT